MAFPYRFESLPKPVFRRLVLALLLWLPMAATALAHASLTGALPGDGSVVSKAPALLRLSFSEPVSVTSLRLTRPDRSAVPLEKFVLRDRTLEITPPDDLGTGPFGTGTHVLSWRVVSEDGHPVGGAVVFSIGQPTGAAPASGDTVDWSVRAGVWTGKVALYLGFFFGIGGVFGMFWFARSSIRGVGLVSGALVLGLVGTVVSAGFQGLDTIGAPVTQLFERTTWVAAFVTSFGRTVVFMVTALAFSALALVNGPGRGGRWISAGGLVTGAFAFCLSGHASAADPQWIMRPAVFLHALAISVWTGALIPLMANFRARDVSSVLALARFSRSILPTVALLAAAGIVLAVVQVREPEALWNTDYGKVLLVKVGLLCLLFLLAAFNRWRLTIPAASGDAVAARLLVRSIVAEMLVVLLIFGVASAWRFTPPPRTLQIAAAQPISTHIHGEKAMAQVTVTPGRAGLVDVSTMVLTGDFEPLDAQEVSLVFASPDSGIEPIRRKATKGENSTWTMDAMTLPYAGKWTLRVDILIDDFNIARLDGEIELRP